MQIKNFINFVTITYEFNSSTFLFNFVFYISDSNVR